MKNTFDKFDAVDVVAFIGMVGSFVGIIVLKRDSGTFKDVLQVIVFYYIGKKSGEMKKLNGNDKLK